MLLTSAAVLGCLCASPAFAKQPLETETARLPQKGHGDVQFEFEYATSDEGKNIAAPIVLEYGISDRLKFVIEPDVYAWNKPKGGPSAHGFGDTEAKLVYLVSEESRSSPALAFAAEIKIPTGKKPDFSSGKADYRFVGIASKRSGKFDLHANLGYTFVTSPAGESLPNIIDYSVAAEYEVSPKFRLVSEVLGTSPLGGGGTPIAPIAAGAEAEGTTITGLVGGIYRISPKMDFALAATFDSGSVFLIRTALTFKF
jgi:Putative MetA-pathway of phenol degradation